MADLTDPILVLNAGSSTLKASLVAGGAALATTEIAWPAGGDDAGTAPGIVEAARAQLGGTPVAVGYRIVHGGAGGTRPLRVDDALVARIEALDRDPDEPEAGDPEVLAAEPRQVRVVLSPARARAFARRAQSIVAAGRPPCPFCGGPLETDGHICPRANGYKR